VQTHTGSYLEGLVRFHRLLRTTDLDVQLDTAVRERDAGSASKLDGGAVTAYEERSEKNGTADDAGDPLRDHTKG
jgi:hypothetical protein